MKRQDFIEKSKRIVVKVGTSILTTETGRVDDSRIENIVEQLAKLQERGLEVILVSSGSIASGIEALGFSTTSGSTMPQLQASASVGQGLLIHKYASLFKKKNINVGQVLLTQQDAIHRQTYVNAKNTLNELIKLEAIPIINENDSIAIDEIKFDDNDTLAYGDNDTLAALVANIVEADLLIILSDVDGLYRGNPKSGSAEFISEVEEITENIVGVAGGSGTAVGKGGMQTKISAAIMAKAGTTGVIIANGHIENILSNIFDGQKAGTFFAPENEKINARRLWILNQPSKGTIYIDEGAGKAIREEGRSLLAVGVIKANGSFESGDAVKIKVIGENKPRFIKGLVKYSSAEIDNIAGKNYKQIKKLLKIESVDEVVHRNDMVRMKEIKKDKR